MPTMPRDSVLLLTIRGRTVTEVPYFDSFVFARAKYVGEQTYEVELQQPELEIDIDSAWISLPPSRMSEPGYGVENPFRLAEQIFERDFDLEDLEVTELRFSGPSNSDVREFFEDYFSESNAKPPIFTLGQVSVDGHPIASTVDDTEAVVNESEGSRAEVLEISGDISYRQATLEDRSREALVSRIECGLSGLRVGNPIDPIVDEDEPDHVLVPGSNGAEYSLTICGTWLVCEPKAVEQEHWDDGDEFTGSAYWTSVSHYEPELRLENPDGMPVNVKAAIRLSIMEAVEVSDLCRASMLLTIR